MTLGFIKETEPNLFEIIYIFRDCTLEYFHKLKTYYSGSVSNSTMIKRLLREPKLISYKNKKKYKLKTYEINVNLLCHKPNYN